MSSVTSQLHRAISYFAEHLLLVEELHDRYGGGGALLVVILLV